MLISAMIQRSCCALFALCLLLPTGTANDRVVNDLGLLNPAERDFTEFQTDTTTPGSFARKDPAFADRTLTTPQKSTPQKTETIRQVSTTIDDPFPTAGQPTAPPANNAFDWGIATQAAPNYAPLMQNNNFIPYDPQVYAAMQNMVPMGMEQGYFPQLAMQQFATQPFAQFPQQYHQGLMMDGMNPYMNPYANMYVQHGQYGQFEPYNSGYQNMQEQQLYQMFMLQELARQQAEARERENSLIDESKQQADANWTLNNLVPLRVSSPLGETMLVCARTISPFSTPPGPDKGVGMPLVGRSWLDHPYYFGGFVGVMSGSELVSDMIKQKNGGTGGLTFGYNFSDYWGLESRLHFAAIDIRDTAYARELFEEAWRISNPDAPIPPQTTRTNQLTILDAAVHYYPLGNAKWRPYFKYGLGVGQQKFVNTFGYENKSNIITMPMGLGVRYWWNERIAIQMDLHNNVIFASGIAKTQCNFAFTMGLTYSFGNGRRTPPVHYWPATPSMGSKW